MRTLLLLLILSLPLSAQRFPPGPLVSYKIPAAAAGGESLAPGVVSSAKATPILAGTTISVSISPSGANRGLFAFIGQGQNAAAPHAVTSVLFNTVESMTAIPAFVCTDGNFVHGQGYYLIAPSVATANVTVILTTPTAQISLIVVAVTNMHQTSPLGTAVTNDASGTTASVVASSATTEIVLDATFTDALTVTVGTGNSLQEVENIDSDTSHAASWVAGAASVTPSWTLVDSQSWVISAIPIKPP